MPNVGLRVFAVPSPGPVRRATAGTVVGRSPSHRVGATADPLQRLLASVADMSNPGAVHLLWLAPPIPTANASEHGSESSRMVWTRRWPPKPVGTRWLITNPGVRWLVSIRRASRREVGCDQAGCSDFDCSTVWRYGGIELRKVQSRQPRMACGLWRTGPYDSPCIPG